MVMKGDTESSAAYVRAVLVILLGAWLLYHAVVDLVLLVCEWFEQYSSEFEIGGSNEHRI